MPFRPGANTLRTYLFNEQQYFPSRPVPEKHFIGTWISAEPIPT